MTRPTGGWTRGLRWIVKLLIVGAVIYGIRGSLAAGLRQLGEHEWSLRPAWLALGGVLYLASTLPAGVFWWRVLLVMGQKPRLGEALRAYFIGHLGKYVPGKALVVILRAGLVGGQRVDPVIAGVGVFVETLTMMAVGAFLAAAILPLWFRSQEQNNLILLSLGLMAMVAVPTIPPIFRRILRFTPVLRKDAGRLSCLDNLRAATLLQGWLLMAIGWCITGTSLWAVLHGVGADPIEFGRQLPLYTATVALANVVGFLSMIPGGAFVREAVLMKLLEGSFGVGPALAATIVLRLVWLVAEVLISVILYFMGPRLQRKNPEA